MTALRADDFPDIPDAACHQHPHLEPEAWQPLETPGHQSKLSDDNLAAIWVCENECAAQQQCLAVALRNDERHGIWGGRTAAERETVKRRTRRMARVR